MNEKLRVLAPLLVIGIALSIVIIRLDVTPIPGLRDPIRPNLKDLDAEKLERISDRLVLYMKGKAIVMTINTVLLGYLTWFYLRLYRKNDAVFSLGLMLLSGALLLYSLSSNPLVYLLGDSRELRWLAAFNFLPDVLTTIASGILVYLSKE
ncbi:MAG: hypothetical protein NWE89_14970 [Candidatus Bathyarchaeota archaeon]|nr:hypothetical protein [Candidatus Bathyarchaeota archaeon]